MHSPVQSREPDVLGLPRGRRAVVWIFVGLLLIVAEIATIDLIGNLVNPIQACNKALPTSKEIIPDDPKALVVTSAVRRNWPPPLVHCEAALFDAPQRGTVVRVSTVTTMNLLLVALLDVIAIAILAYLARIAISRRRRT